MTGGGDQAEPPGVLSPGVSHAACCPAPQPGAPRAREQCPRVACDSEGAVSAGTARWMAGTRPGKGNRKQLTIHSYSIDLMLQRRDLGCMGLNKHY